MGKIKLDTMEFHAFHGVYPDEKDKGNQFTVDVEVDYPFEKEAEKDDLGLTVNYEVLYDITRKVMEIPSNLLEHLAMAIAREIRKQFPDVLAVTVGVSKFNPPIGGKCRAATVTVTL
ncbi:MAG: dihydroneopterin aldolase [Bacteroidota bacterium]